MKPIAVPPRFKGPGRFFVREAGLAVYFGDRDDFAEWDEACDAHEATGSLDAGPDLPEHVVVLSHECGPDLYDEEAVAWIAQALNMAASKPPERQT